MSRKYALRALATVIGLAVVYSCSPYSNDVFAPKSSTGGIFDQYVAIGNSITAGYQSGGIVDSTQRRSYAFLLAQVMGTRYQYASLGAPGCPPMFGSFANIVAGTPRLSTVACGLRANSTDILNNVGVPGAKMADATDPLTNCCGALTQFILGGKTQLDRAIEAKPTFVSIWLGNNDVLGYAVSGSPPNLTSSLAGITSQTAFSTATDKLVDSLTKALPSAKGVIIGVVNVINVPLMFQAKYLFTSVTGNIRAAFDAIACGAGTASTTCVGGSVTIDPSCTATSTELIHSALPYAIRANQHPAYVACSTSNPFGAQGVGDAFVLDATEQATITTAVNGFNTTLQAKATAKGWAYVDPNTTLLALKAAGTVIRNAPALTATTGTPFGTGMSFDGVHPAYLAHVSVANAIIAAINAKYSTTLPVIVP